MHIALGEDKFGEILSQKKIAKNYITFKILIKIMSNIFKKYQNDCVRNIKLDKFQKKLDNIFFNNYSC